MARTKVSGPVRFSTPEAKAVCERLRIQHILNQPCSLMDNLSIYYDDSDSEPNLDFLDDADEKVTIRTLNQYVPLSKACLLFRKMQLEKLHKEMLQRKRRESRLLRKKLRAEEEPKWVRVGKKTTTTALG